MAGMAGMDWMLAVIAFFGGLGFGWALRGTDLARRKGQVQ